MMLKKINPFPAFANGQRITATAISVVSVSDNLFDHVIFKYTLHTANGMQAGEASFELLGLNQYQTWDASPDGAYTIVAEGIGVEFADVEKSAFFEAV